METVYLVYTDGADRHKDAFHIGAWCTYIKSTEDTRTFSGIVRNSKKFDVTNNRMELLAIVQAVRMCHEDSKITLYSDSEYSVGVLSGKKHAHVNTDLIKEYNKIVSDKKLHVHFEYIPREQNDFVDHVMRYMLDHNKEAKEHGAIEE